MTATLCDKRTDCNHDCSVSDTVKCDLRTREPERIDFDGLFPVSDKELIGYFADDTFYDRLITEDCDVYLRGEKVLAFRKALFPKLKDKAKDTWEYFRWAGRDLYSDGRGMVAGRIMNTDMDVRVTNGILNFFKVAAENRVEDIEQAEAIVARSPDGGLRHFRIGNIKKDFPRVAEALIPIEKELRKRISDVAEREQKKEVRGEIMRQWFPQWLKEVWAKSPDKAKEAKRAFKRYLSSQVRANRCYSNILGAMDRSARVPYCRLSMSTQKKPDEFRQMKDIYQTACAALQETIPNKWESLYSRFSGVNDPHYNLFGTCFTTLTVNWNFRTAFHRDANNCEGGIAVLTALTKGEYEGHYLVFPELRLAFDLRDGDFLAGDNQGLVHGNTAMIPKTPDAERVSLVFYSRERMVHMEDMECEGCRKDFLKFSAENLSEIHGTGAAGWNGIYEGMWHSDEWIEYKASKGLERCGLTNWWATEN